MAVDSQRANLFSRTNGYSSTAFGTRSQTWLACERFVAATIILCATILCCFWAIRVPVFQEPDEVAHADASFAFFDIGRPFIVPGAIVGGTVMPETRFLIDAIGYRKLRYDKHATVPKGYGTRSYFHDIDQRAPAVTSAKPAAGSRLPYALALYPSPYYFLVGTAMRVGWVTFGHSLSAAFFAGRILNVAMLSTTLVLTYLLLVELRFSPAQRLMLLAAIAFFPMSIWMGAYVQPDNQSALFLVATLLAAVALLKRPRSLWLLVAFAAAATALGVTKLQYAVVAIAAIAVASRHAFDREPLATRLRIVGVGMVIPTIAAFLGRYLSPFGSLGTPPSGMVYAHLGLLETVQTAAADLFHGIADALLGGDTFATFWFHFGVRSGNAFSGTFRGVAEFVLVFATLLTFAAWGVRQYHLVQRLRQVAARYGQARAIRFIGSDPSLNMYVLLSGLLFAIYAFTGGYLTLQGRYWYPILVPMVVLSVRSFGGAVPRKHARTATTIVCSLWLCYSALASPGASIAMERDFYDNRYVVPKYELGEVESVSVDGKSSSNLSDIRVESGHILSVRGAALDTSVGLPASDVRYKIDGGDEQRARTNIPDRTLWIVFNDEQLRNGGFDFDVVTEHLAPGPHELSISAYEQRAPGGLPIESLPFFVTPRARN